MGGIKNVFIKTKFYVANILFIVFFVGIKE